MGEHVQSVRQEAVEMMHQEKRRVRKGLIGNKLESQDMRSLWGRSENKGARQMGD